MRAHTTLLRTILLSAVGAAVWACSSSVETCDSCGSGTGDGDSNAGDGDSGDGDTGDGDGSGGDGDAAAPLCTNPQMSDTGNGLVSCDEGYRHRAQSAVCENALPRDVTVEWPEVETGAGGAGGAGGVPYTTSVDECSNDADCPDLHYCLLYQTNATPGIDDCHGGLEEVTPDYARVCQSAGSGCVTDNDCESNQICACGVYAGHCVDVSWIAGCRTDGDCEGKALCLAPQQACQLPEDECHIDADCGPNMECYLASEAGRICRTMHEVVCGRPFLVDGDARLAPSVRCSGWQEEMSEIAMPSDEILRAQLAAHFTQMGLMEHASVAAFARFTLQLLSLGAPADLVEASNAAIIDETRHARQAFALASAHARDAVGPGRLPLEGAFDDTSWQAILEATVREGCIGETRAALEASWAAEQCADPVVREMLQAIARDEGAHAQLAWRVVTWMLGQKPELAALAHSLFESAASRPKGDATRPERARAFGVLSQAELSECWHQAQRDVIAPCAVALLSQPRTRRDRWEAERATLQADPSS